MKKKNSTFWLAIVIVSALVAAATTVAVLVWRARRRFSCDDCFDYSMEDYDVFEDEGAVEVALESE